MKIIITKEQLETLRENDSKGFNCDKCDHSWKIKKEDNHPYLCNMCGYDSHKKKYNYDELENFWKNYKKEGEVTEKWTEKYKKSINCSNPKGFSQRAHCQGKKKHLKESKTVQDIPEKNKKILLMAIEFVKPEIKKIVGDKNINITYELSIHKYSGLGLYTIITKFNILDNDGKEIFLNPSDELDIIDVLFDYLKYSGNNEYGGTYDYSFNFKKHDNLSKLNENIDGALKHHGFDIQGIKIALKVMSEFTYGEQIPLIFNLNDYELKSFEYSSKPILSLLIDVNTEDGEKYEMRQINRHEISVELLHVLEMLGLYNDEKMSPYYQFHFNVT
jgi:hypothetical protein